MLATAVCFTPMMGKVEAVPETVMLEQSEMAFDTALALAFGEAVEKYDAQKAPELVLGNAVEMDDAQKAPTDAKKGSKTNEKMCLDIYNNLVFLSPELPPIRYEMTNIGESDNLTPLPKNWSAPTRIPTESADIVLASQVEKRPESFISTGRAQGTTGYEAQDAQQYSPVPASQNRLQYRPLFAEGFAPAYVLNSVHTSGHTPIQVIDTGETPQHTQSFNQFLGSTKTSVQPLKEGVDKVRLDTVPDVGFTRVNQRESSLQIIQTQVTTKPIADPGVQEVGIAGQVAKSIMRALKDGIKEYRIKLTPEGLGEVAVTMRTKDRELTLNLRTGDNATRELILGRIGELKSELSANEYQLNGVSVEVGNSRGEMGFSGSSQEHGNQTFQQRHLDESQNIAPPLNLETASAPKFYASRSSTINYRI